MTAPFALPVLLICATLFFIYFLFAPKTAAYKSILSSGRYSRHFYYSAVFSFGFFFSFFGAGLNLPQALLPFTAGLALINLLFLSSLILNNLYDNKIDAVNKKSNTVTSQKTSKYKHLQVFAALFIFSCLLSLCLSLPAFILTLLIHLTAYIYSCPPLRFKRFFLLNTAVIASSTILAALLGAVCAPGFDPSKLPVHFLIVLFIALTLAFNVKDVNDYKGDKKYHIATVITVCGEKTGRFICACFAFCGYFMVSFAADSNMFLLFTLLPAAATFLAVLLPKKKINETLIFSLFFIYALAFIVFIPYK